MREKDRTALACAFPCQPSAPGPWVLPAPHALRGYRDFGPASVRAGSGHHTVVSASAPAPMARCSAPTSFHELRVGGKGGASVGQHPG